MTYAELMEALEQLPRSAQTAKVEFCTEFADFAVQDIRYADGMITVILEELFPEESEDFPYVFDDGKKEADDKD